MKAKYDKIGTNYNLTRKADKYLSGQLLEYLNPKKDGIYLDIGCGTGNYTTALQTQGYKFIGIDPSFEMLGQAKAKNPQIDWQMGTAENTSLRDNSVDGIIAFLTLHHWPDLKQGFMELYRVLEEKGSMVIFTSTSKQMQGYWLNHYFPKMLQDSILQMPSFDAIETAITAAGFEVEKIEPYSIKPDLEDKFLYCGKHDPEIYFDENVRHGISSFSALANLEEVEKGLNELRKDIDNGKIKQIIQSYENDMGDYLFIKAVGGRL